MKKPPNIVCAGFTKGHQAANYFFWLSELQPIIAETDENKNIGPMESCKTYELSHLHFSYPLAPDSRVLKGVSMTVSTVRMVETGSPLGSKMTKNATDPTWRVRSFRR